MMMIRLAVIGTNWITDQFIEGALKTGEFQLVAVYSRSLDRAKQFAEKYDAPALFTDLKSLGESDNVDAVYIASPNVLHGPQSIQMMQAGKHVICEKPLASDFSLAQQMYQVAKQHGVVLFEAFITPHLPNFSVLKQELSQIGAIRKAVLSYCQYSSRYPKYLKGEMPNTFLPEFSNGSIMDIGYYCLGSAIELFGEPKSVQAQAHLLETGVDGNGSVILGYDGFDVLLMHSKTSDSYVPSEIQGEEAALHVEMISTCNRITRINRGGQTQDLSIEQHANRMFYEAHKFADQIQNKTIDEQCKLRSLTVSKLLTEIRRQTGVIFPTDNL
ncbi:MULTISPECIES: Gfo/Idh/MocA family protein [unclassified Vibrio]|uniref:Gfo/Idh/MocA family protein n=1 Tax=unclassified Vibrio TaxID=2614977 RepID=UPI000B8E32BD|nr:MULTISPECIES: Gfo/Idh/MocA family oxidoreductase [unclassified Vibrio]NAW97131.1 Gfo/Idh/MocA family oxidoreductase [Vibrio sp. V23_P3S9T160]OXX44819.1 oxidoreductase [Vibrio sp. V11_P1A41T118]